MRGEDVVAVIALSFVKRLLDLVQDIVVCRRPRLIDGTILDIVERLLRSVFELGDGLVGFILSIGSEVLVFFVHQ